jgi:hypothetical protein
MHSPARPLVAGSLAVLCTCVVAWSPAAFAHELDAPSIDVQTWQPVAGVHDGAITRSARPMDDAAWAMLLAIHYTRMPLVFVNDAGTVSRTQMVVGDLWMAELGAAVGWHGWTFAAGLPASLDARGGGPNLVQVDSPTSPAFGDLRVEARKALHHIAISGGAVDLGAAAVVGLPTAAAASWLGGTPSLALEGLATLQTGAWQADLNAGLRLRSEQALSVHQLDLEGQPLHTEPVTVALRSGSSFVARVGVLRRFLDDRVRARAEAQLGLQAPWVAAVPDSLLQLDGALSVDYAILPYLRGFFGLSGAPTTGPGSASLRAAVGLTFDAQEVPSDDDGDGLVDKLDRCPNQAEDRDGFEDQDGCPDADHDQDGLADRTDRCPMQPEDMDGFQDEDGCPDPDDDGDGVLDAADACPHEAEDKDGFQDADGCVDADNDEDSVPDVDDLCPQQPENRNGFEDSDGCPDTPPRPPPPPAPVIETPAVAPAPAPPPVDEKAAKGKEKAVKAKAKPTKKGGK